jgi:hypothetical protein
MKSPFNTFHCRTVSFFSGVAGTRGHGNHAGGSKKKVRILILLAYIQKGDGMNYLMAFDDPAWPNGSKMTVTLSLSLSLTHTKHAYMHGVFFHSSIYDKIPFITSYI